MKVFPHTSYEKIDRSAARHLCWLLQRYNWSLEDPTRYQERWAVFWPSITLIERKALALFVMANSGGGFGVKLHVSNLPVDLEVFDGHSNSVILTNRVRAELERIVGAYYTSLASREDIAALFARSHPEAFSALESAGGMNLLYQDRRAYPLVLRDRIYVALVGAGLDDATADRFTGLLDMTLQTFIMSRELEAWK